MAFPTVQTADTTNGVVTSNSTSWTLTYPTNIQAGDLLLAFVASDGNSQTPTWPAGWVKDAILGPSSAVTGIWVKKLATGSETGTFNVTGMGSEQGAWRVFRITGWEGTLGTTTETGTTTDGAASGLFAIGTSATANPTTLTPHWGADDTLWIAMCAVDTSRTITTFPANCPDLNTSDVSGGAGGATLAVAMSNLNAIFFDPNAFAITSDDWVAFTVAVRPVAAATGKALVFDTRRVVRNSLLRR